MIASSGARLVPKEVILAIIDHLLPIADILTPNIEEAKVLCELQSRDVSQLTCPEDLAGLAKLLLGDPSRRLEKEPHRVVGPRWVLLKGGHLPFTSDGRVAADKTEAAKVVNVLVAQHLEDPVFITSEFTDSRHTHGTGCTLACKCCLSLPSIERALLTYLYSRHRLQSRDRETRRSHRRRPRLQIRRRGHQEPAGTRCW